MPKDSSGAGVRVSWSPELTFKLLEFLKKEKYYRQVFFPRSSTLPKDRHLYARAAVMEFFKKDEWMRDAKRRGLAKWDASEKEWRPTTAWGSHISNPINCRINLLRQRMSDGFYEKKYQVASGWTSFDDIPNSCKRATFRKLHPYYFILKELCEKHKKNGRAQALEHRHMSKVGLGTSKRRKRSSTLSTSSPSLSSDSESDSGTSIVSASSLDSRQSAGPRSKKVKRSPPTSSILGSQKTKLSTSRPSAEPTIGFTHAHSSVSCPAETNGPSLFDPPMIPRPVIIPIGRPLTIPDDSSDSSASSSVIAISPPAASTLERSTAGKTFLQGSSDGTPPNRINFDSQVKMSHSEDSAANRLTGNRVLDPDEQDPTTSHSATRPAPYRKQKPVGVEQNDDFLDILKKLDGQTTLDVSKLSTASNEMLSQAVLVGNVGSDQFRPEIQVWLERQPPKKRYMLTRGRAEMGLELLRRMIDRLPKPVHFMGNYQFFFHPHIRIDRLIRTLESLLRTAGAECYSHSSAFRTENTARAFQVVWLTFGPDAIETKGHFHPDLKLMKVDDCITKFISLCRKEVTFVDRLREAMDICATQPVGVGNHTCLFFDPQIAPGISRQLRTLAETEGYHVSNSIKTFRARLSKSSKQLEGSIFKYRLGIVVYARSEGPRFDIRPTSLHVKHASATRFLADVLHLRKEKLTNRGYNDATHDVDEVDRDWQNEDW